ncbi:MAG: helix-turn-helix domain-containing protein [Corallococcus sp.]|nr:helix-turn-helix domain-containing protein [Corallococcus sp.]
MGKITKQQSFDIVITGNVAHDPDLSYAVKFFYGSIRGLMEKEGFCYASNEYLAERFDQKERTVRAWILTLENKGYIFRSRAVCPDGKSRRVIVLEEMRQRFYKVKEKQTAQKSGKNLPQTVIFLPEKRQKSAAQSGKNLPPKYIDNIPVKNNKSNSNIREINPQTPLQGGKAESLAEQGGKSSTAVWGSYRNVIASAEDLALLRKDFGGDLLDSLVEQLSAYKKSRKRKRFSDDVATLRDWALRRTEPEPRRQHTYEQHEYTQEKLDLLFTNLEDLEI